MKTTVAVIGAGSMIGSQFVKQLEGDKQLGLISADLAGKIAIDITNINSVNSFFKNHQFNWAILFAAFTDVTSAESQRNDKSASCWKINVEGSTNIALACKTFNRKLIFISTAYVFDGTNGLCKEEDPTGPNLEKVTWYGITKIEGEKVIVKNLTDCIIIRINYPYSGQPSTKEDLTLRILKLFKLGELYPIYTDQIITPTYIPDIAPALKILTDRNFKGTVHLASPTPVSQFDFASRLISLSGVRGPKPIEKKSIQVDLKNPTITPRPEKSTLSSQRIISLGFKPTSWQEGLEKIFRR